MDKWLLQSFRKSCGRHCDQQVQSGEKAQDGTLVFVCGYTVGKGCWLKTNVWLESLKGWRAVCKGKILFLASSPPSSWGSFNMFNVGVPSGTDHLLSWLFALSQLWRLEKHPFQVSINMCVCSSVGKDFTNHVRWQRLLCKELQCKMEMKYINLQYDRIVSILLVRIFACLPEFQSVSRLNPI